MSEVSTRPGSLAYSATPLRAETAGLLHDACRGFGKMVAAALGVTRSRVDRMHEGADANYLELLARELDRIEIESGVERVVPVLRWLSARYGYTLAQEVNAEGGALQVAAIAALRDTTEGIASTLAAAPGGIDDREAVELEPKLTKSIERLTAVREGVRRGRRRTKP